MSTTSLEFPAYDRLLYNGLPSIESADEKMRKTNKLRTALLAFGPIFVRHHKCDMWGISILHRHWQLEGNELPVQEITSTTSPKTFTTAPRAGISDIKFWPSLLAVGNTSSDAVRPLEFSGDPSAGAAFADLKSDPEFAREFREAAITHSLDQTFGLISLKTIDSGFELVEFNYDNRTSVLHEVRPEEIVTKTLYETTWRFSPDEVNMACEVSCFARCVVGDDGGHSGDHPTAHNPD